VHGLNTELKSGNELSARYEWDFGDEGSKYNSLVGFNAAYVYDNPGNYTVTLSVWNGARGSASASFVVNVAASGRRQIFVSGNGNDNNSGSQSSPIRSFSKAAAMVSGKRDIEVLFERGDAYDAAETLTIGDDNVRIGAYGSGTKPFIYYNGPRDQSNVFYIAQGAVGTVIENITIDSRFKGPESNRKNMPFGINVDGYSTAIRAVTFINVGYAIQTNGKPSGLLVQDSDAPTDFGVRSYFLWGQGEDFVLLGNKVVNSTHEHPVRIWEVDRVLMAFNDFANPQVHDFETSKTALNLQAANYAYVYGNTFRGPRIQIGPLGGADGIRYKEQRTNFVVFEQNQVLDTMIEVVYGTQNITIRNNVFKNYDQTAINVDGFNSQYNRGVENLNIINNTAINEGTRGRFLSVNGQASGIYLINNLYRADNVRIGANGNSSVLVDGGNLSYFKAIANNVWPESSVSTWIRRNAEGNTAFSIVGNDESNIDSYLNLAEWNAQIQVVTDYQQDTQLSSRFAPGGSTIAATTGLRNWEGIFVDYYGNSRPAGNTWSVGAVEV